MDVITNNFNAFINQNPTIFILLTIWTLVWKGLALWKSSQKRQQVWFVVLLVLNTLGVLEILYYFFFSNMKKKEKEVSVSEDKSPKEEKEGE